MTKHIKVEEHTIATMIPATSLFDNPFISLDSEYDFNGRLNSFSFLLKELSGNPEKVDGISPLNYMINLACGGLSIFGVKKEYLLQPC